VPVELPLADGGDKGVQGLKERPINVRAAGAEALQLHWYQVARRGWRPRVDGA